MVKVSGMITLRNAEEVGYPYVQSILSVLPATDEFLINDGGSDDGTLEVLETLEDSFGRVELYEISDDGTSERWDAIDRQLEQLIEKADGEWLIESQCDEVWPRPTLNRVEELMRDDGNYNSIRQPRLDVHTLYDMADDPYSYGTVRCVRKLPTLQSTSGGDSFLIDPFNGPPEEHSAHNVPPEKWIDDEFYHLRSMNTVEHAYRHAEWLATESDVRQGILEDKQETHES